jgi:hypothetical protein
VEEQVGASFAQARDICLSALEAIVSDAPLPESFPHDEMPLLADIGRRLGGDEHLLMGNDLRQVRVDHETRARLANRMHREIAQVVALDGEIEAVDDSKHKYHIRTRAGRYEADFTVEARDLLLFAQRARPLVRISSSATVEGSRVVEMDDLSFIEDERFSPIDTMQTRLRSFEDLPNGWANGSGIAPYVGVVERSRMILSRVLVENPKIPVPSVFPTVDGGIQAEWVTKTWAVDVCFDGQSNLVRVNATNLEHENLPDEEFELEMDDLYNVAPLVAWLAERFEVRSV